jgi:WD40 repeat protein
MKSMLDGGGATTIDEPYIPQANQGYDIRPTQPLVKHTEAHSGKEGTCLRFNPQGTLLGTAGGDSTVRIWDVSDGSACECLDTLRGFAKPVSCLAFSALNDLLLCCTVDRQLKFYSLKQRRFTSTLQGGHSETINSCAFCYSQPLAMTASSDRTIKVWDTSVGAQKSKMTSTSAVYSLDVAMSDSVCVSGHRDGNLRFWGVRDGALVHEVKNVHDDVIASIAYMPNDGNKRFR